MRNNTIDEGFFDDPTPPKKEYFWQHFEDQPVFCGFNIKKGATPEEDKKIPMGIDGVAGVSADASNGRLGSYKQAKDLGFPYVGVSLNKPIMVDGMYLVCLDFDWKKSPNKMACHEQIDMMAALEGMDCCYEASYSGSGAHFWVLCKEENLVKSWKISSGLDIEVFSGFYAPKKNVLITDHDVMGELKEVNLKELFPAQPEFEETEEMKAEYDRPYSSDDEYENARKMLGHIPPEGYDDVWIPVGMILKSTFGDSGFDLWNNWSSQGSTYDPEIMKVKWESFKREGLTMASLAWIAKQYGYRHQHKKSTPLEDFGVVDMNTGELVFAEVEEKPKKSLLDAAYISPTNGLQAPQWVVDGIIPNGVGVIAGVGGVGKTTALMPIVATVAGFDDHLSDIKVKINRHVIYITEDPVQAQKAIYAIKRWRKSDKDINTLEDYVHLFNSNQYKINDLKTLLIESVERYSMEYRGIIFPPLVVFDTASANIAVDNENDNAEIARYMTMFKQLWAKHSMPIWLVNHLAKSANGMGIDELEAHSARGASAWRDNSNWTANLAIKKDSNNRILQMMKVREELDFNEIEFSSVVHTQAVLDVFGDMVDVHYRYCTATRSSTNARAYERISTMDEAILRVVRESGYPSVNDVKNHVTGSGKAVGERINYLVETGKLFLKPFPEGVKMKGRTNYLSDSP